MRPATYLNIEHDTWGGVIIPLPVFCPHAGTFLAMQDGREAVQFIGVISPLARKRHDRLPRHASNLRG